MARDGRDELELYLDDAPSVQAAKRISQALHASGAAAAAAAKTFDQNYKQAFQSVENDARRTAEKVKSKWKEVGDGFKTFALGNLAGGLSASAVESTLQGIASIGKEAFNAYIEGDRAATFLNSTQKRYNLSLVETQAQIAKLRQGYNLSRTEAENALGGATRAAAIAGDPSKGFALLTGAIKAAGASGVAKDQIPDLIRQIASGQDEAFDKLFGVNPSFFYDQYAKSLGRTAASLSDLEKAQARLSAVIDGGVKSGKAYEEYQQSSAGHYDKLTAKASDYYRALGEILTRRDVLASATGGLTELAAVPAKSYVGQTYETIKSGFVEFEQFIDRVKAKQKAIADDVQAMIDYRNAAVAAREEGPLADVRRSTAAEIEKIRKANTEGGQLSTRGLFLIGQAASFGAQDEAKKMLEVNKQLDSQLAEMKAKYSGDLNPLTQIALAGKREMDALLETVRKLGPEFQTQGVAMVAAAQKLQDLNFAKGLVQNYLDVSNIQERIDSLSPDYERFRKLGRYGQLTDQFDIKSTYRKETEIERAQRLLAAFDDAVRENSGEPEVQRAARQALLSQTSGVSPETLGADPTVRDRILAELQREKEQRIADRAEALREREAQRTSRDKQDKAAEETAEFLKGLKNSGLTGEEIGKALKKIANMSVGVDLNVSSDRPFQAAVPDGTALDRVTTG